MERKIRILSVSKVVAEAPVQKPEEDLLATLLVTRDSSVLAMHLGILFECWRKQFPTMPSAYTSQASNWMQMIMHPSRRMFVRFMFLLGLINCTEWRSLLERHSPYRYINPLLHDVRTRIDSVVHPRSKDGKRVCGQFDLFVAKVRASYLAREDPYGLAEQCERSQFRTSADAVAPKPTLVS